MKIVFLAVNKSPFMVDLMSALISTYDNNSVLYYLPKKDMDKSRKHWNSHDAIGVVFELYPASITQYLDFRSPDVVICVGSRGSDIKQSKRWCKKHGKKFFMWVGERLLEYTIDDNFKKINRFKVLLKYYILRRNAKNVNGIIGASNRACHNYCEFTDVPVLTIPYTFDLTAMLAKEKLPFDGKNLVFLYSGRMLKYRDPLYAIRLYSDIVKSMPEYNCHMIISGRGPQEILVLNEVKLLGLEEQIEFVNEFKDWYDIHNLYYKAHIQFLTYSYAGWALTVTEGMAAGQFLIGCENVDAIDQIIIDGFNGMLTNKRNNRLIIERLKRLLAYPQRFEECRDMARKSVVTIGVKKLVEDLRDFIEYN